MCGQKFCLRSVPRHSVCLDRTSTRKFRCEFAEVLLLLEQRPLEPGFGMCRNRRTKAAEGGKSLVLSGRARWFLSFQIFDGKFGCFLQGAMKNVISLKTRFSSLQMLYLCLEHRWPCDIPVHVPTHPDPGRSWEASDRPEVTARRCWSAVDA